MKFLGITHLLEVGLYIFIGCELIMQLSLKRAGLCCFVLAAVYLIMAVVTFVSVARRRKRRNSRMAALMGANVATLRSVNKALPKPSKPQKTKPVKTAKSTVRPIQPPKIKPVKVTGKKR